VIEVLNCEGLWTNQESESEEMNMEEEAEEDPINTQHFNNNQQTRT
jgi:hypothetical protein